jgi:hypothetical protein
MLKNSSSSNQISFEATPFPYLCIDDFLTNDECASLIQDAADANSEDTVFMHGGRFSLGSVSPSFKDLVSKSKSWTRLVAMLKSDTMANLFLDHVRKECPDKYFTKWLTSRKFEISEIPRLTSVLPQFIVDKVKSASDRQVRFCTKKQLFFISFMALFDDIYRLMHSFGSYIFGKRRLTLLFDYSVAKIGYSREVHRDSDARVIVFLLYLNDLEDYVEGGSLKIHDSKVEQKKFAPRPGDENVYIVNEFKPKVGRLVMFLNTANSYHSVEKMTNSEHGRHFLYGAYTLSSGFGSLAKIKSSGKLPTEYNLYRE